MCTKLEAIFTSNSICSVVCTYTIIHVASKVELIVVMGDRALCSELKTIIIIHIVLQTVNNICQHKS